MDARCEAQVVTPGDLPAAIARMRADSTVVGAAVTMPHTVAVTRLLDGLGPEAKVVKAVNTISHRAGALVGWNTDRPAFSRSLEDAGFQVKGKDALVLGAGGAARASVDALRAEATKIWVSSRDLEEARAVCRDLEISSGGPAPLGSLSLLVRKVDLVVNATPVGSDGEAVPFPIEWITPAQFIFDLVYRPWCGHANPSKVCPACEGCACSLPGYENPLFWKEAPLALRRGGFKRLFLLYL